MSGFGPRARSTLPRMLKSWGMLAVQSSGVPGNACWGFGLAQVSGVSKFGLCRRKLGLRIPPSSTSGLGELGVFTGIKKRGSFAKRTS